MHTQLRKPPVRQRQVHQSESRTTFQQKHVDQRPEAQRMIQLKQLAATRARPEDQQHDQLQALANQSGSIQRRFGGDVSPDAIHSAAQTGIRTPSTTMPHLEAIQQSFGSHHTNTLANIQYHQGSTASASAQAMNAKAYATGSHVVSDGPMDKHTAAHEATHIVQQQAGVQLKDNIGTVGDPYERQADAVADAVVAGRSAEGILGENTMGTNKPPPPKQFKPAREVLQRDAEDITATGTLGVIQRVGGGLWRTMTSIIGGGISQVTLLEKLELHKRPLDLSLATNDLKKKNQSWIIFFEGFAKEFEAKDGGVGIEHGSSHVLKDFLKFIRLIAAEMLKSRFPQAATYATSVLKMISIWLTKHANEEAEVRKPTLVKMGEILRRFLDHITSHLTHSSFSERPSSLSGIDGESDRMAEGVEYAGIAGDQVKNVTDGINADQMREGVEENTYWEQVTADTNVTEGVAGFTTGIVGLLGMAEGMYKIIQKRRNGERINLEGQELITRLQQVVAVAEGATGLGYGGAIGAGSMAGEAVSAFLGGFGDILNTLKALLRAYETNDTRNAIDEFINGLPINEMKMQRTQIGQMMEKIRAQAVADVQWFLELNLNEVPNQQKVYMPSKDQPVSLVAAREQINKYLYDPVIRNLISIQIQESSLSQVSKELGAKVKQEGLNAVASAVSAAGVVTAGVDAGTGKVIGIALKTGALINAIEGNRRLNASKLKGVEATKAEMGKQTRDGTFLRLYKDYMRRASTIADQKAKLMKQLEVVEDLAENNEGFRKEHRNRSNMVIAEWQKAGCLPVHDPEGKAKMCAEMYRDHATTENRATRLKVEQNALSDYEKFATYFYNTMSKVTGYPYYTEAQDLLRRIGMPDWPNRPKSTDRMPESQAKRMLVDKIDK